MNISNPNTHGFTPHPGYKSPNSAQEPSSFDNFSSYPDKTSPFKYPQQNTSRAFTSKYEKYEGPKYQSTTFSDRFNTRATLTDSISQDLPGENRWLSKGSRDLRGITDFNMDNPPPSQIGENRSYKTLSAFPAFQGAYKDLERSKSHSRTRSSPYGINENHSGGKNNLSQKPRLRKEDIAGLKERKRMDRRRGLNELTPRSNMTNNRNLKTEGSIDEQGLKMQFYRTERVGSGGFFSPPYDGEESGNRGKYFGMEQGRNEGKRLEERKVKNKKIEAASFEEDSYRNREYRNKDKRGFSEMRGSKVDEDWKENSERHKSEKLEKELRECQNKMAQLEKYQEELYQNYVEAKGEAEKAREEKKDLLSNISFHIHQNGILNEKLSQLQERGSLRNSESLRLKESYQSDVVSELEVQVGKMKRELVLQNKKHEDEVEDYQMKMERLEKEKQGMMLEKGKLQKRMEEYVEKQEKSSIEDKAVLKKSLEERNRQVKTLKQKNEELNQELERMKKQRYEKADRQYMSERETAVTGRYETDRLETKRMIEEALNQTTRRDKSPDLAGELKRYKAEIEKLKAENESLKVEVQGQSTLRRFDQGESPENKTEEHNTSKEKGKKKSNISQMGELGKVMREIMKEVGVDDINDAALRIRELQESNKTNNKFTNGVIDLVYKCSPSGYFETRPTTKQAWKWLQRLMEEYMTMKKHKGSGGEASSQEKDIINNLIECLKIQNRNEIVDKVKDMIDENGQVKKAVEKLKAAGLDSSFGPGDVEKMMDKYGASYNSLAHSYSTAKFEDLSKVQSRNSKEFSFARTSGPKLKKILDVDSFDLAEDLLRKKE